MLQVTSSIKFQGPCDISEKTLQLPNDGSLQSSNEVPQQFPMTDFKCFCQMYRIFILFKLIKTSYFFLLYLLFGLSH